MDINLISQKFGGKYYVSDDTYQMGVHYLLGREIAKRFLDHKICLDACLGAGFMALALAKHIKVIGADINPLHLEQAKYNADIALVGNKIEFILGDVLKVIEATKEFDSAFLDPDWSREGDNKENHVADFSKMVPPADLLLQKVFGKTKNICLRLPKTFDLKKLEALPEHEIESVYLDNKLKFYCIYFGNLIQNKGTSELRVTSLH